MITFNPGPSQLSTNIKEFLQHLAMGNFLSLSHRSPEFIDFFRGLIDRFRVVFSVPQDYSLFFVPSATAAMSITVGNLIPKESAHFVHGAFSKRFADTAREMGKTVQTLVMKPNHPIDWLSQTVNGETELIALTHNETSTGLMWPVQEIYDLRKHWPDQLLAVDVTSSFGAIPFDLSQADIWFGSVQKVLGLPAGLGFMIVSPRARDRAFSHKNKNQPCWMDFDQLGRSYQKPQTIETPSALHLAMLDQQLKHWDVQETFNTTMKKAERLYSVFQQAPMDAVPFVTEPRWRSLTVASFDVQDVELWHQVAAKEGFVLGSGYGEWKNKQIRVANFPALTAVDFQMLFQALRKGGL